MRMRSCARAHYLFIPRNGVKVYTSSRLAQRWKISLRLPEDPHGWANTRGWPKDSSRLAKRFFSKKSLRFQVDTEKCTNRNPNQGSGDSIRFPKNSKTRTSLNRIFEKKVSQKSKKIQNFPGCLNLNFKAENPALRMKKSSRLGTVKSFCHLQGWAKDLRFFQP